MVVLIYHHLIRSSEGLEEPGVITVERLESHIQMMLDEGYRLISPAAFTAYLEGHLTLSGPSVLITFDDGYESNYVHALPLFKRYGVPAVIFPVMKFFHSQGVGAWSPHLVKEHVEVMRKSGLFLFGGHTYDGHGTVPTGPDGLRRGPWLATRAWLPKEKRMETEEEYRARIRADLERTVETLRQIGEQDRALHFALPNGAHSPIALEELRRAGFRYIYTTDGSQANRPGSDLIHRVDAGSPHASVEWLKGKLESLLGKGR